MSFFQTQVIALLSGEEIETAEVNITAEVTLAIYSFSNKLTGCFVSVCGELRSLYDRSVIECNVNRSAPGKYSIQYTPTVRGRHELSVSVDGQEIANSPFPVFVSIHPTKLGKPVKILGASCLNHPGVVTMTSSGQVIVGQFSGDAVVFLKEGEKLKTISKSLLNIRDHVPVGLAIDLDDNIYLASCSSNQVVKFSKDCSIVNQREVMSAANHHNITVTQDKLMIVPRDTKGTIVVYSKELKYVSKIVGKDMGQLHDISSDSAGNLHVTDVTETPMAMTAVEKAY